MCIRRINPQSSNDSVTGARWLSSTRTSSSPSPRRAQALAGLGLGRAPHRLAAFIEQNGVAAAQGGQWADCVQTVHLVLQLQAALLEAFVYGSRQAFGQAVQALAQQGQAALRMLAGQAGLQVQQAFAALAELALEGAAQAQFAGIRGQQFGGGRRRGRAHVGAEIADRYIGFMAHGADNRRPAGRHGARHAFLVEAPQVFQRAAAGQNQRVEAALIGQLQGADDLRHRLATLYRGGNQRQLHLGLAVLEGEVQVPGSRLGQVGDFALHPDAGKYIFQQQPSAAVGLAVLLAPPAWAAPGCNKRSSNQDPAHCLISGTGLTHLGSAAARDKMHQQNGQADDTLTDTMQIFRWGMLGGRPQPGTPGAQPEWFYKGDGGIVVRPGEDFPVPDFAEEPELAGLYVIGEDGAPYRLGYALGNEFSDHVVERKNYLYLAHSKLRFCSFGLELRLGKLPGHLTGIRRIRRGDAVLWEKEFLCGEENMCHSLENLEYHHFKYAQFLRPGDVHVHFFGTATLSFADGVKAQPGDRFEISLDAFGEPPHNGIHVNAPGLAAGGVKAR